MVHWSWKIIPSRALSFKQAIAWNKKGMDSVFIQQKFRQDLQDEILKILLILSKIKKTKRNQLEPAWHCFVAPANFP
jgi:hypothetical protein